jgi:uncharacterized protein (DUF1015 family)
MVAIAPFRALRYNLERAGDLSVVVAPPYDVISPEQQAQLYAASPYNIVRLILGRRAPADTETDNWYTRAKRDFQAWQQARVLVRDEAPAVYLYEHAFDWEGQRLRRLGCVARLSLDDASVAQVLAHESTFEGPKADRARLLDMMEANLSPIFCVVPDPQQQAQTLMRGWADAQPPLAAARVEGDQVRLWAVTDAAAIGRLQRLMAPASLLIADGHHRFAVAFAKRARFGTVMIYVSCLEDPAVRVRPIHRVVRLSALAQTEWVTRLGGLCDLTPASSQAVLTRWLESHDAQGRFGCYIGGGWYQVQVREEVLANALLRPTVAPPLAGLDVTLLHQVLLPRLQGGAAANGLECAYTPDASQAAAMVDRREGDCAWLLRGLPMAQLWALARQGVRLPQKTTYFYPKLLSGLFINPLE